VSAPSRWRAVLVSTGAVLLVVNSSRLTLASPLFELTGGVQGNGGLNARTVEGGSASAYFNPAFLPDADSGFDLGVFVTAEDIGIRLRARTSAAADVSVESLNAEQPGGGSFARYGVPTIWLENGKPATAPDIPVPARPRQSDGSGHETHVYQVIGFVQKLFEGRVGVGLYAMVPYSGFTGASAFYVDEREQYFSNSLHPELYSDRMMATSVAFGLGVKASQRLSLGVGATLSLQTSATTPTYLADVGHFRDILVDSKVSVKANLSPHFGVVYKPSPAWRLTATVHTPQKLEIDTNFTFLISNGVQQSASIGFTHDYLPWQMSAGVSHDVLATSEGEVSLVLAALYARWSDYVDRHGEHPAGPYAWYDTIAPSAGVRVRYEAVRLLFDVMFQPSPVPAQTGRTNYVDSDRIGTTAGVDYSLKLLGGTLRAGFQGQVHRLLPRETSKLPTPTFADGVNRTPYLVVDEVPDNAVLSGHPLAGREGLQTNNPGWPGFGSAGWILGGGVHVSFTY
jgi:long-chain fatty acid transport protein